MAFSQMKKRFYNNAPVSFIQYMADQGIEVVLHNGEISDIETTEVFNHAHPVTFCNCPAGTARAFKQVIACCVSPRGKATMVLFKHHAQHRNSTALSNAENECYEVTHTVIVGSIPTTQHDYNKLF